jgi:rod shape determining protein RodA
MNRRVFLGALAALALAGAPSKTTAPRWWSHIKYLAADELAGRETASEGDRKAAKYIAAQFERAGFAPYEHYTSALETDLSRTDPRAARVEARLAAAGVTLRPLDLASAEEALRGIHRVSLAAFVYERVRRPFGLRQTIGMLALGLAPAGPVFLQPDLGTGIVLVAIAMAILFVAGIPWQHFAAIGAAVVLIGAGVYAAGSTAGVHFLHGYQQDRLTAFLHPSNDPRDASYQVNQAVIAVGSGEEVGRGNDATQTELLFLPERHTDFIYAVIGERFGFIGAAFVILLYAVLFWRAIRVMRISRSFYGTMIAAGVVAMLAFQVIVNVGMNLGLMPVTGITLPLMSYGGSSVLGTFLALGVLQAIHADARNR